MIVIYHFEAKNSKKFFGPNATSGECTIFKFSAVLKTSNFYYTYSRLKQYRCMSAMSHGWENQQYKKEVRLASVSLVIVIVFILSHGIKWIINAWEVYQMYNFKE